MHDVLLRMLREGGEGGVADRWVAVSAHAACATRVRGFLMTWPSSSTIRCQRTWKSSPLSPYFRVFFPPFLAPACGPGEGGAAGRFGGDGGGGTAEGTTPQSSTMTEAPNAMNRLLLVPQGRLLTGRFSCSHVQQWELLRSRWDSRASCHPGRRCTEALAHKLPCTAGQAVPAAMSYLQWGLHAQVLIVVAFPNPTDFGGDCQG